MLLNKLQNNSLKTFLVKGLKLKPFLYMKDIPEGGIYISTYMSKNLMYTKFQIVKIQTNKTDRNTCIVKV